MNACEVLRHDLQQELAAAFQLMDDKEYGAAALCFRTASGHASQLADRLARREREKQERAA